jgi:hypothetical protein
MASNALVPPPPPPDQAKKMEKMGTLFLTTFLSQHYKEKRV